MLWDVLFWLGAVVAATIGFLYFRDLGDISQMVLKVKRENMARFIRHEYRLIAAGLAAATVMVFAHLGMGGGSPWVFWPAVVVLAFFYGFPYLWIHLGLRNQRETAKYYSIEEAKSLVSPSNGVVVIEKDGVARAHPDSQIMRPHLAGDDEGLAGENVVMTYCAMANLGIGYTPEIEGEKVKLEVVAQHPGPINATIGGRNIVLAYDPVYESVGAWYNDSGVPVTEIDFFGKSDRGQLKRVERLKSGVFWHVWAEFFPHTDINRVGDMKDKGAAA
jgi:hypothetical protein